MTKKNKVSAISNADIKKETNVSHETITKPKEAQVYCGPSVKGVARQFTVYSSGLPDAVKEFLKAHPIANQLMVPVSKFAETRVNLEVKGTREMLIYNKIKSEL